MPVDVFALRDIGHLILPQGDRHRQPVEADEAGAGAYHSHDTFEQCGFAAAVNAEQPAQRAAFKREAGVAQGGMSIMISDRQTAHRQVGAWVRRCGGAHWPNPLAMVSTVVRSRSR